MKNQSVEVDLDGERCLEVQTKNGNFHVSLEHKPTLDAWDGTFIVNRTRTLEVVSKNTSLQIILFGEPRARRNGNLLDFRLSNLVPKAQKKPAIPRPNRKSGKEPLPADLIGVVPPLEYVTWSPAQKCFVISKQHPYLQRGGGTITARGSKSAMALHDKYKEIQERLARMAASLEPVRDQSPVRQ
jgi:hypothetical protein